MLIEVPSLRAPHHQLRHLLEWLNAMHGLLQRDQSPAPKLKRLNPMAARGAGTSMVRNRFQWRIRPPGAREAEGRLQHANLLQFII